MNLINKIKRLTGIFILYFRIEFLFVGKETVCTCAV